MARRTVTALLEKWQLNDLSPVDYDLTCGIVLEMNHQATERQLIDILFMFPGCGLPVQWKGASRYASNVRKRVATAVGKKKMGSLPDVFSFAKKKTKAAVQFEQRRQLDMIESQSTSPNSGCGSGEGATGQVVTGLLAEEPSKGVVSADNTHTREPAGASNAAGGRDLSTADVGAQDAAAAAANLAQHGMAASEPTGPPELPQMISRLTAAKLYQCSVARSCITHSLLDMVNARQQHKYPEEDRERLRLKARYCAEQHHLGLGIDPHGYHDTGVWTLGWNGEKQLSTLVDPLVLPLRPAAAESFVSPRPSPADECGSGKRSCTPVTVIDTVQKDKRLKQTVTQLQTELQAAKNREAQLRKTADDADAGVEGLLRKMELLVDQLNMNDRAITSLKWKVSVQDVRLHERSEKVAEQHETLQRQEKRAKEAVERREEVRKVVREELGEELEAERASR